MGDNQGSQPGLGQSRIRRFLGQGPANLETREDGSLLLSRSGGGGIVVAAGDLAKLIESGTVSRRGPDGSVRLCETEIAALPAGPIRKPSVNSAESPIDVLARRKGRDGRPWLTFGQVAAAERLRADFERACLQPSVTMNWRFGEATGGSGAGGAAELGDMALAARRRVNAAIAAVGPELSGLLLDVCCFLKGLELVEHERRWPARSAKIMLATGLSALARHYSPEPTKRTVGHWGSEDYRPAKENWPGASTAPDAVS